MILKGFVTGAVSLLLWACFSWPVAAMQCDGVFPNGASSHENNGFIDFGYNSQIIAATSNVLATSSITTNNGSNKLTCQSQDCSASGSGSDIINVGDFVSTNSNTNVILNYQESATVGGNSHPGNSFNQINGASEATITFSSNHNEYFIDSLSLGYKNILYLQAGSVYWINQLATSSESRIIIQGSGTATVYVNQTIAFSSPGYINSPSANSSGDASKLVLYTYSNVTFSNQTTFTGSLYSKGNITLGSASYAFGAISASNISLGTDSTVTYQAASLENTAYGEMCTPVTVSIDHFRIEHDTQGLTCEAETVTVKACTDASCSILFDQPTSITLAPGNWSDSNTFSFTGSVAKKVSITTGGNYTFSKTASSESADLKCFSATTETCEMTFVDTGFEFIGAQITDKFLPDQLGEQNFVNANLRAVQNNNGVCEALLEGEQEITLGGDCISPSKCLTAFSNIGILVPDGETTGQVQLTFAANGIAPLSSLSYADAGRLALRAQAQVDGVTITSGSASIDVLPKHLTLNAEPEVVLPNNASYPAGEGFLFTITAYGAKGDTPLPNYQPGQLQMAVKRTSPDAASSVDGQFNYANNEVMSSSLASPGLTNTAVLTFDKGWYSYQASYDEVGVISVEIKDAAYLSDPQKSPRVIAALQALVLGAFRPAYFDVEIIDQAELANACGSFSYVGQEIGFEVEPSYRLTAKNARGGITKNYAHDYWHYAPDATNGQYLDSSDYVNTGTATVISSGSILDVLDGQNVYDGSANIVIADGSFGYDKVNTDFQPFAVIEPFAASMELVLSALMLTDRDGVCYQNSYPDGCESYSIIDITGTSVHHGRLILEPNFGPETDILIAPLKAQHYINGNWQFNAQDSCTDVAMQQSDGEIVLTPGGGTDITGNIDPVSSVGDLVAGKVEGVANFSLGQIVPGQTQRQGPGVSGLVKVALDPSAGDVTWPDYMNFDWSDDGLICANNIQCPAVDGSPVLDGPTSILSFGSFRGNDRIIHWREVFN